MVYIIGDFPVFFLILRPPPTSTLFPKAPLFRFHVRRRRPPRRAQGELARSETHPALPSAASGRMAAQDAFQAEPAPLDRKSTRLNSSHDQTSYAVFCFKKKTDAAGALDGLLELA